MYVLYIFIYIPTLYIIYSLTITDVKINKSRVQERMHKIKWYSINFLLFK